jgi:hypothetical protein
VSTVFFGGGTPTLLAPEQLTGVVAAIDARFGLAPSAEVTTEANPDSVDADSLRRLRDGGINRISFGMQSAVPHVLQVLDRTHDPERLPQVVQWAREAGFEQVSVDLIYGTPGESLPDWERSVDAAVALGPDHVSAYALVVEEGTALARRVARGELPDPRRRRPRRQVPAGRRAAHRGRLRLVRDLELGPRRGRPLPAQRAVLDQRQLVGGRARSALARRRASAGGTSSTRRRTRSASPTGEPGARARVARRRHALERAGAAGAAPARRDGAGGAGRHRPQGGTRPWWPTVWSRRRGTGWS